MKIEELSAGKLDHQISRFCLYGFLKNLQFFEPFLILAFRDKGLSFGAIGLLISFRAVCVNLLEVPSGAAADIWGKRKCMILSMLSYIASFVLFAFAREYIMFFPAMFCFAIGEAFRTGTHKAMIFNWISRHGMKEHKTRIYGLTRSWSKQGSSVNCIIAAAIIVFSKRYDWVFLLAILPYTANIVNLSLYPSYLDDNDGSPRTIRAGIKTLMSGIRLILTRRALSSLIFENVCFEGAFSVVKDYLQPLLKTAALTAPILLAAADKTRTAILVAVVYFILNQLSSTASRKSHLLVECSGSEQKLGRLLWLISGLLYAIMLLGFATKLPALPIMAFIALFVVLNIWKPVFVSRFHDNAEEESAATTLSIANQSKTLVIAVAAPLLGMLIDHASSYADSLESASALWPIAALGLTASVLGALINGRRSSNQR